MAKSLEESKQTERYKYKKTETKPREKNFGFHLMDVAEDNIHMFENMVRFCYNTEVFINTDVFCSF